MNSTGFKVGDKVKVIGDHDQAGFIAIVVAYDSNFKAPLIEEAPGGIRYLVYSEYLEKID